MSVLVAGLGQRDRGDDAIGPEVAAEVASRGLPGVTVIQQSDPLALLDVWDGAGLADLVIVIDAIRSGEPPGTLQVVDAAGGPLPARTGASTHAFGLAAAVELARALGRLPARLVIVGVEAGHFRPGEPLSPAVRAAVGPASQAVAQLVRGRSGE
jgi:hydrogenase maturation protease